ncbi:MULTISPECIES: redoxin domain-containing protein [Anaerococcus]|jgi:alkyl hydroperoxide reductase/ thiol specific antioxidant/ mal allergen|uniref:Peroxiredoxin n=1 Tax=Anaerococcus nagyae TaxID=1755241 RepID=A0A3E2TGE6_9FIRM|nr:MULTISPECIES: redoxin domain-containing protein [Anaerococcus]MBP2070304.1 peroxiredoxin [Anaerococcus nagyae]MDU1864777.1 redoxin domain-containing protein [Anaerococcus sp.]MDU2353366.1 redoxin domain-containing protein [Anaerococcus sp.]MDU2565869.1 redoxin domain-containing protein [Anaerococcus sp.]RGB75117.1 peroxiredoxin [Anaerococcus nagyae]
MTVKIGDLAPDFRLKDQNKEEVKLADLKGKKVILSWHPLAFTSVCTDQMRSLERNYDKIQQKADTVVIGLSIDPFPAKQKWADILCIENVKIASDFFPYAEITRAYGLFNEENGASQRANVIIDEDGKIQWVKIYEPSQLPDVEELIENL